MKFHHSLLAVAACVLISSAHAGRVTRSPELAIPMPGNLDSRIRTYAYTPDVVYTLYVTVGMHTHIQLGGDERLKENIEDAADPGAVIDAIQIRQFDWIATGEHQDYGVVAQELEQVYPPAVPEATVGPDGEEMYRGVDYSKLVPLLVKEVQLLRARVAQLEGGAP